MPPADSASRAGVTPKAGGDRSSRTLAEANEAQSHVNFDATADFRVLYLTGERRWFLRSWPAKVSISKSKIVISFLFSSDVIPAASVTRIAVEKRWYISNAIRIEHSMIPDWENEAGYKIFPYVYLSVFDNKPILDALIDQGYPVAR